MTSRAERFPSIASIAMTARIDNFFIGWKACVVG
jgi:hypothetical protein